MQEIRIKVSTDQLKTVFANVTTRIANVQKAFDEVDQKVTHSTTYWESQGHDSMQQNFEIRKDDYQKLFKEFEQHIRNLQEIAGVYEKSEKNIAETANSLPNDLIVKLSFPRKVKVDNC